MADFPISGVMNCTQAFWDEIYYGNAINLCSEQFELDYWAEHGCEPPEEAWECVEFDEPDYLIGDWKKDEDGLYVPDEDSTDEGALGFSAILQWLGGAPLITVVWSKHVRYVRSMCSPCCPGQADLDSGEGSILAYAVDDEWLWNDE